MTEEAQSSMHPSLQFLLLVVVLIGFMFVGIIVWMLIITGLYGFDTVTQTMAFNTSIPHIINSIWMLQILSTTIPVFAAPYVFGRYVVNQPKTYLKLKFNIPALLFVVILIIMFCSSPLMECLININQKMVLPKFLAGLEQWMRKSEAEAAKETALLLTLKSVWQMLWALFAIGLLTAIAEEFLFRGCIQAIFTRWTKSHHLGIWIAAILFSAIHMQFFGFLPRLMLGVFFGYFVWWSGSIWTSVWGHFINNGTAVVVTYLFQQKTITMNPDDQHVFNYGAYAFSLIITVLLFIVYRKLTLPKPKLSA